MLYLCIVGLLRVICILLTNHLTTPKHQPDCLETPSSRPGHYMDLLSSTGLILIGTSVLSLSIAQAKQFYGHLEPIFDKKLEKDVRKVLHNRLDDAFDFVVPDVVYDQCTNMLRKVHAKNEVNRIIEYMTGM